MQYVKTYCIKILFIQPGYRQLDQNLNQFSQRLRNGIKIYYLLWHFTAENSKLQINTENKKH